MRRGRQLIVMLLIGMVCAAPGQAEPVRIQQDGGRFAQGWLFTDYRGVCRVVTAAHVLVRGDKLIAPLAVDRRHRDIVTSNPAFPDRQVDIAFLEAHPATCSTDTLSEADADRRLSASVSAFLEFVGLTEDRAIPLVRRARAGDDDGGRTVLFEPNVPNVTISQGMSGAPIVDGSGKLLAAVFKTDPDTNRAFAVRTDTISALLRGLPTSRPASSVTSWSVWYGKTMDPQRGVNQILARDSGWTVAPDRGFVTFGLQLKTLQPVGSISFDVDEANRGKVVQMDIFGSDSPTQPSDNWPTIGACSPPPGTTTNTCEFLARSVRFLRIQAKFRSAQVTLSNLTLGSR